MAGNTCYRAAARASVSALAVALCAAGCSAKGARSATPAVAEGSGAPAPAWLPPYTAAQQKLLVPVETPIQVPALRTYPDLERFGYANNRPLQDLRESFKFTKLVAQVVQDSPRLYLLDEAGPELANTVAQYGPQGPAEADAWAIARREGEGGRLVRVDVTDAARADYTRGETLRKQSDYAGAASAYRAAAQKGPGVPAFKLALGDVLAAAGDRKGARAAYEAALAIDATIATGHVGLAELASQTGDQATERRELAEALAYHPSSVRARQVADVLTSGAASAGIGRFPPFSIFVDVDSVGAIHVVSTGTTSAQLYASCRAVMRYEPEVRAAIFDQPRTTPYYLSVAEEVVCLEAAIGAYLFEMSSDKVPSPKPDPSIEALAKIANDEGLSGYVMFEILGQHRPERARMAPADVHHAMLEYIAKHVLGGSSDDAPNGVYTASMPAGTPRTPITAGTPRTPITAGTPRTPM